jgi:phosphoadenosine phosphosulfate reductase
VLGDLWGNYSEEDLYQIAISRPLEEKIASAILLIQTYEGRALQLSPDGYYVCNSGGKDSIVMERLFRMAGVKYQTHYNNVTIDPPELVRFLKKEYPETIWHSKLKPLPFAIADDANGPPTRLIRWCCNKYKEQGGAGIGKAIGVRAAESPRRKGLWSLFKVDREDHNAFYLCPILYWTDADIWQFIRDNNMPYCCLYDQGYSRLGCIGCPMARKQRQRDFDRWPGHRRMWLKGFQMYWDKYHGKPTARGKIRHCDTFSSVNEWFSWWMEEGNVDDTDQPDCQQWLW